MATTHTFKAASMGMSVAGGFGMTGHFVLNGSVNSEGAVNIRPSSSPGRQEALYTGDLASPTVNIEFNPVGWEALSQLLRAADSVEIRFTSASDLVSTPAQTRLTGFDVFGRRNFE